ncbi:MAG: hypothetical protein WBB18_12365 [Nodosilinea sp.]
MYSQSKSLGEVTLDRKVDILQLFFFLLGAPHISGVLRSAKRRRQYRPPVLQYASVGLLAMAIASAAELFLL